MVFAASGRVAGSSTAAAAAVVATTGSAATERGSWRIGSASGSTAVAGNSARARHGGSNDADLFH